MKVKVKLIMLILSIVILSVGSTGLTFYFSKCQEDDALLVNIAGRQRMLSQRISKNIFILATPNDKMNTNTDEVKKELLAAINLFDTTIKGFINGGEITTATGEKAIIGNIKDNVKYAELVISIWEPFKKHANSLLESQEKESLTFIMANNNNLLSRSNDVVNALQKTSENKLEIQKKIQIISIVLVIAMFVLSLHIIFKDIVEPINQLVKTTRIIATGDLTLQIQSKSKSEIGVLSHNFNDMVSNLKSSISTTLSISDDIVSQTSGIKACSLDIAMSSDEIAKAIREVATGSSEQAIEVTSTYKATEDLSRMIDQIIDFSIETKENTKIMTGRSSTGISAVKVLKSTFDTNAEQYQNIDDNINQLSEKSQSIENILNTINNIAEQTNLLSLNAAIEAARAGEQGKGFAVVAEEVRKLAEASRISTDRIRVIINDIVQLIGNSKESLSNMDVAMEAMTVAVVDTETALNNINSDIDSVAVTIEKESESIQNMGGLKDVVLESMENISAIVEESAAAAEEISATSALEFDNITQLTGSIEELYIIANALKESGGEFKL